MKTFSCIYGKNILYALASLARGEATPTYILIIPYIVYYNIFLTLKHLLLTKNKKYKKL